MSTGIETERKFIVRLPDVPLLSTMEGYTVSAIRQTYLTSDPGVTHRVRERTYADRTEYYETKKTRLSPLSVIEEETAISEERYRELLGSMAEGTRTVEKVRHTVKIGDLVYEFDVYPDWQESCIMEVELPSEDTPLPLPAFIHPIEEVTGIRAYSNAAMARRFPEEKRL